MKYCNTYRQLLERLNNLTDEQLECNLSVELLLSDECFSSVEGDFRFEIADTDNSFLDQNHPVFVVHY